jgi:MFS family permease
MKQTEASQEQSVQKRSLWRNRDFLLLMSGQAVSVLGTNISVIALPLLVLAITHSPAQAGLLTAARQIPYLFFSLPAGALVDRWDRKATMIRCDLLRWLALGSVPLAFALGHLTLAQLYIVAFIEGTAFVFFSLAQISALPQVVEQEHIPRAYALDTTIENVGMLLGPSVGAFIIGLAPVIEIGAVLAYLADSISYLVSVISLRFIRVTFQEEREKPARSGGVTALRKEIAEGLRFLWSQPILRIMVLLSTTINFLISPVTLVVIVLARNTLHLDVQTLGFIVSAAGIGGLLGAFAAPWLRERLRFGQIIIGSVFLWVVAIVLLAVAQSPVPMILGSGLIGLIWGPFGVTLVTYRLSLTPDYMQGRVNSAYRFFSYGAEPLGAAVGGFLLVVLSPRTVLAIIALGLALAGIAVCFTRLRKA